MSSKRPFYEENRPLHTENRPRLLVLASAVVFGAATVVAAGCGDDPAGPDLNPDFMVGDWVATSLR